MNDSPASVTAPADAPAPPAETAARPLESDDLKRLGEEILASARRLATDEEHRREIQKRLF